MSVLELELLRQVRSVVLLYPDDPNEGMSWPEVIAAAPALDPAQALLALQQLADAGDLRRVQTAGEPARYFDPSEDSPQTIGEGPVSCWRQGKSPAGLPSPPFGEGLSREIRPRSHP